METSPFIANFLMERGVNYGKRQLHLNLGIFITCGEIAVGTQHPLALEQIW